MRLEVGKRYTSRDGRIAFVESVEKNVPFEKFTYPFSGYFDDAPGKLEWWNDSGCWYVVDGEPQSHMYDLIQECNYPETLSSREKKIPYEELWSYFKELSAENGRLNRDIERMDADMNDLIKSQLNEVDAVYGEQRMVKITEDSQERKNTPIATGVLDYFPLTIAAMAQLSKKGNDKHNPGQPLHWSKDKSNDHADCVARHLIDRGKIGDDGTPHSVSLAWRACALCETELESK